MDSPPEETVSNLNADTMGTDAEGVEGLSLSIMLSTDLADVLTKGYIPKDVWGLEAMSCTGVRAFSPLGVAID